ncbi:hypothetical protein F5884DRAFT_797673 [Xylogone sp. PMI_703]|nr:hypothetical protein F5884DRAFT_797673 [Xylogone sp. PMI_703]
MATAPPKVYTYHCLCSSLLLTSTHTLTSLPRRLGVDKAIIIPLPAKPPVLTTDEPRPSSPSRSPTPSNPAEGEEGTEEERNNANPIQDIPKDLPPSGFSMPLHMRADKKPTVIRREDGFERRLLWRCGRCKLVVGYQIASEGTATEAMDVDSGANGKSEGDQGDEETDLKVLYLLPGGLMSTEAMTKKDLRIEDADVGILNGVPAWE